MDMDNFNDCFMESLFEITPFSCDIAKALIDHYILIYDYQLPIHGLRGGIPQETTDLFFDDLHKKITELKELRGSKCTHA